VNCQLIKTCWRSSDARAELVRRVRGRWQAIAADLEHYFDQLQSYALRLSWKTEVRDELRRLFDGSAFRLILEGAEAVHKRVLRGRVFVALHMHAGDGNVHTNIPVNSDDYEMLARAERRGGAHHAPRARARRRDLRRARHRHHQARSSSSRRARGVPRL
jgi:FAD/FMN-containing dehydrogenase